MMSEQPVSVDSRVFSASFGREPLAATHTLVDHQLLTLDAIAELADSLPRDAVERHEAKQPKLLPGGAPDVGGAPSDTVRGIESNGCWMVLWYIEQSRPYAELLDRCLDSIRHLIPAPEGGMRRPEAFLFLSAPGAVTPVHFDPEHNFLLQIRGWKEMHVCRFEDPNDQLGELNRYYDGGHRNLEALPAEHETFRLDPGKGVYVPSFMPHWVQNGDMASISLSITFRTRRSERAERAHAVNAWLRRVGTHPQAPGSSELADRTKELGYVCLLGWRSRAGRIRRQLASRRVTLPHRAERPRAAA
jgi:Cupin superfamily protein